MIENLRMGDAVLKMNDWGAVRKPFVFLIDFKAENAFVLALDAIPSEQIKFQFNNFKSDPEQIDPVEKDFFFESIPVDQIDYFKAFQQVQDEIHKGNSYWLNLTFPTSIHTNLSLLDIFHQSKAPYKCWWKDHFVVFSPETFIQIKDTQIATFPMKGTIDALFPAAEAVLLSNRKEKAEHATIVDLLRNDLNLVAKNIQVERYRYLDRVETHKGAILQTSTKITGDLPENYHAQIGTILQKLLPAGSVTGAPKKKTVEIIDSAERYERGFYSGIMGYFDGWNLDSAVMIRFIEQEGNQLYFKSGGGITAQSEAEEEYQELMQKVYLPFTPSSIVV